MHGKGKYTWASGNVYEKSGWTTRCMEKESIPGLLELCMRESAWTARSMEKERRPGLVMAKLR
jgi:hypothetical protein